MSKQDNQETREGRKRIEKYLIVEGPQLLFFTFFSAPPTPLFVSLGSKV